MSKAIYVTAITVDDRDGNQVELEVYKHENGGLFAIDASFIGQCTDEDHPEIPDPFSLNDKSELIDIVELLMGDE